MAAFLQSFEEYLCVDVIESAWHWLKNQLQQVQTFDELVKVHREYLETKILDKCMMGRTDSKIANFMTEMLKAMQNFVVKVTEFAPVDEDLSEGAVEIWDEVTQTVEDYGDRSSFFVQFVAQLATKGYYRELYGRIAQ